VDVAVAGVCAVLTAYDNVCVSTHDVPPIERMSAALLAGIDIGGADFKREAGVRKKI
jgi:hypothetical protein